MCVHHGDPRSCRGQRDGQLCEHSWNRAHTDPTSPKDSSISLLGILPLPPPASPPLSSHPVDQESQTVANPSPSSQPSSTEVCAWELMGRCKQNSLSAVTHRERLPVLPGVPPEDDGGDTGDARRARVTWGACPPHGSRVPLGRQGQLLKTSQHRLDAGSDSSQCLSKVWV